MTRKQGIFAAAVAASVGWLAATSAFASAFNIPGGTLAAALEAYSAQSGLQIAIASDALGGARTKGASGEMSPEQALSRILSGTGFTSRHVGNSIAVVRAASGHSENTSGDSANVELAATTAAPAALETVTVTSSKIGGDVQNIPISITAMSQEQLTATQTAGGPDLVKQVPNLTFTKTNFTGYSITIRGIGTQAISVTTDPAVAVAFNDVPFIRNHFFEQEFYDLGQVEVLRGPQGTLYGRNATAGVVNLSPAKPTDQFEAMASAELGNYQQRRFEGMINVPVVDDRLDIRVAGEWTKRQGYSFNAITDNRVDGRDLWSGRVTIGWKPAQDVQTYLVWEHFSEDDDRIRTSKQLCTNDPIPTNILGVPVAAGHGDIFVAGNYLSQGCQMIHTSLYSPDAFQVPNGFSLPYGPSLHNANIPINPEVDPYASTTQSRNLRVIESALNPEYRAKNDIVELNTDYTVAPNLTLTSQTGFDHDFLWSTEDYNRFNTAPGIFLIGFNNAGTIRSGSVIDANGNFCDPQLGCSNRLVAQDLSDEHAWQLSQEFRLASNFGGPLNFSVGGNYLHYETEKNYYVFINTVALTAATGPFEQGDSVTGLGPWIPGVSDNHECIMRMNGGFHYSDPTKSSDLLGCIYIDPNPITHLNNKGHNYFLSQNPYVLNSYAGFGEIYYSITKDVKLTAGLRWTDDQKHFTQIPSELLADGWGYPTLGVVNQEWSEWTGRSNVTWTPKLDFTEQTLLYASYAHGYKAGGANPPGAVLINFNDENPTNPIHPLTFKPEFIDAFELGTKNTLLDGALTFNGNVFYYNYESYQISEIVDRTSINLNFDAHVKGAEIESTWEPVPGLRFNFAGGYEDTALAKGSQAVDLMDRTGGHADWIVVKPFVTQASNCIVPTVMLAAYLSISPAVNQLCVGTYGPLSGPDAHDDPVTGLPYVPNPTAHVDTNPNPIPPWYPGFDPTTAPNGGAGFDKNLGGNRLPNAPPFTVSLGAQYTMPLTSDWAGTLRGDYYWQDYSWARIFNDNPYDRLRGYTSVNLTLILTSQSGWQVMLYDKNVFNTTDITGTFLNSDDSGLTTNVFLTDPKLIGIRVTKNW